MAKASKKKDKARHKEVQTICQIRQPTNQMVKKQNNSSDDQTNTKWI